MPFQRLRFAEGGFVYIGTSNVVMPPDITSALYALISPKIQPFGTLGAYGVPCSELDSITATLDFTFTSTEGVPFHLTIPPEELSVGPFASDPSICQTLINAQDFYHILGGSLLKHYYTSPPCLLRHPGLQSIWAVERRLLAPPSTHSSRRVSQTGWAKFDLTL